MKSGAWTLEVKVWISKTEALSLKKTHLEPKNDGLGYENEALIVEDRFEAYECHLGTEI